MAEDLSIDELIQAVQAVAGLRTMVAKHDGLIESLQEKLAELERRLDPRPAPKPR